MMEKQIMNFQPAIKWSGSENFQFIIEIISERE